MSDTAPMRLTKLRPAAEARITMRQPTFPAGAVSNDRGRGLAAAALGTGQRAVDGGGAPRNRECTWRLAMIAENEGPGAVE
jgi:hypothetical protein